MASDIYSPAILSSLQRLLLNQVAQGLCRMANPEALWFGESIPRERSSSSPNSPF